MWIRRTQNMKRERVKGCYLLLAVGAPSGGGAKEYNFFFRNFFSPNYFSQQRNDFFPDLLGESHIWYWSHHKEMKINMY